MMIREATLSDIPALVELGERMHAESPRWSRLRWSGYQVTATLATLVEADSGFVWVALCGERVCGGMVAMLAPHWCSDDPIATDLALFMAPEARGSVAPLRLVHEYLLWAEEKGVRITQLGITTGVHTEETARLYERIGLKRCGVILEV